jgi:hypothetical protein
LNIICTILIIVFFTIFLIIIVVVFLLVIASWDVLFPRTAHVSYETLASLAYIFIFLFIAFFSSVVFYNRSFDGWGSLN